MIERRTALLSIVGGLAIGLSVSTLADSRERKIALPDRCEVGMEAAVKALKEGGVTDHDPEAMLEALTECRKILKEKTRRLLPEQLRA